MFALTWGLGGALRQQYQEQFSEKFKELVVPTREDIDADEQAAIVSLTNNLPQFAEGTTLFDYRIDNPTRYYVQWSDQTKLFGSK